MHNSQCFGVIQGNIICIVIPVSMVVCHLTILKRLPCFTQDQIISTFSKPPATTKNKTGDLHSHLVIENGQVWERGS